MSKTHEDHNCKKVLHGFLIDPYRASIDYVEMDLPRRGNEFTLWRKMLDCRYIEHLTLGAFESGQSIDLWFDEEFAINDKLAPSFKVSDMNNREWTIFGYGLLTGGKNGEPECMHQPSDLISFAMFQALFLQQCLKLQFEIIRGNPRFDGEEFIAQRMRGDISGMRTIGSYESVDAG